MVEAFTVHFNMCPAIVLTPIMDATIDYTTTEMANTMAF